MRTLLTAGGVAVAGTMLGALAFATVTSVGSSPAAATSNGSQSTGADASAACAAPAKIVDGVCETVVHTTAPAGGGTSGSNSARGAVAEPTASSERGESEVRRDDDSSRESGHEDANDHHEDTKPEDEPEDD